MSSSPTTTSTRPTGLAPVAGLPPAAHAVLHRELLHIHSSLHLILLILRGPWDTVTPSIVDTITSPHLRATLRAPETSIEQIRRSHWFTRTNYVLLWHFHILLVAWSLLPTPFPHLWPSLPLSYLLLLHRRRLQRRLPLTHLLLRLLTLFLLLRPLL